VAVSTVAPSSMLPQRKLLLRRVLDNIVWLILLACVVTFSLTIGGYFSALNFSNIIYHSVFIGLLAIAESFCLISGNMDLSVESVAALSAIFSAWLCGNSAFASGIHANPFLVLFLVMCAGGMVGVINAFFILKLRIQAFLVTLSTYIIVRGAAVLLTGGKGVTQLPESFTWVDTASFLHIPLTVYLMIVLFVVFFVVMEKTRFGKHVFVIGGNLAAAYNFGVKVQRVLFIVFILSGALSALTGWLVTARAAGATATIASGYLFEVLAAVVIGGVSLNGGFGSLIGVFAGVLLLSSMRSALDILAVSPFASDVVRGALVLAAIVLDSLKMRMR
jgi:ribose transport system permease protein